MSIHIMSIAWATDLAPSEKLVLLALADCANDEGACWPGLRSLCAKTGKCKRSLQESLRALDRAGHITRTENPGKGMNYVVHPVAKSAPVEISATGSKNTYRPVAKSAPKPSRTISSSEPKGSSPGARKTNYHRLPENWVPTRPLSTNCQAKVDQWPPGAFDDELESFRAWAANAKDEDGKGRKLDWNDAFGNWIRTKHDERYKRTNGLGRHQSIDGLSSTARAALQVFGPG